MGLQKLLLELETDHDISKEGIQLLQDKGFKKVDDYNALLEILYLDDETFQERETNKPRLEKLIDIGNAIDITSGRYNRMVRKFQNISSEQALVQGRLKFSVEYVIGLANLIGKSEHASEEFIPAPFTDEEQKNLRSIYENFRTKDYLAIRLIEGKTNHDIVAANTWLTILAEQKGLNPKLMRKIAHFARTSADVNTNVMGELYMRAIGQWTTTLNKVITQLTDLADKYQNWTCVAETHGQDAQLTTLGRIYSNLAQQLIVHAAPFLQPEPFKLEGKIAGAIGTDADFKGAFPDMNPNEMYNTIIKRVFGLHPAGQTNDQDATNAYLSRAFDTMVNVGNIIIKSAADTWLYASRGVIVGIPKEGESGSSAMPQKVNPFFSEGTDAIQHIANAMILPIKEMVVAYREQGDLRRSITKREGFHPVMLSIIGMERFLSELNKYEPNAIALEEEIYKSGPKIASSVIQNMLRAKGVESAYDDVKKITMKPVVNPEEVRTFVDTYRSKIGEETAETIGGLLQNMIKSGDALQTLELTPLDGQAYQTVLENNQDISGRKRLLGNAVEQTQDAIQHTKEITPLLTRYAEIYKV